MAFLCNPNNPTGRLTKKDDVLKIADAAKQIKCYLVVDEAFIDFTPDESVVQEVQKNPYLIVLRSMTKFYALSGLRIGYGIFPSDVIENLKKHKEPWTVNSAAQLAGITALNDTAYINKTFELMKNEKKAIENGFKLLGINYIPSFANFYLISHDNAKEIISGLRNMGILLRDCSNFKGLDSSYMRAAVKSNKDNMRLLKEMTDFLKNPSHEFISGDQEMLKKVQHHKVKSI
jgi:threonine-phosphate decarboxylase